MSYPHRPTQGSTKGAYTRIVVALDPETFADVVDRAKRKNISTTEQLRQLVEWGLMAEDEEQNDGID